MIDGLPFEAGRRGPGAAPRPFHPARSRGSVLVGLLWCVALLGVVVVGALYTSRLDLLVAKNYGDLIQAHYLALAGVEKAKAVLYQDAGRRRRMGRNYTGSLEDAPGLFRDVHFGRGQFRVFYQGSGDRSSGLVYGIQDEESRLNISTASTQELAKLPRMTAPVAAAIVDYRDPDNTVTPGGAEIGEYASLDPPYKPRNGPLQTTRELLMVRGVTPELFLGEDANQNGLLDPEEDDGNANYPPDNHDGVLDAGWSSLLTAHSGNRNVDASARERVHIKSADENTLAGIDGISSDLAKAIVAYRGQHRLESLADLLDVTPVRPQRSASGTPAAQNPQSGSGTPSAPPSGGLAVARSLPGPVVQQRNGGGRGAPSQPAGNVQVASGPKLISSQLLMQVADHLTAQDKSDLPGLVNINSAPAEVLACLPGLAPPIIHAIVAYRHSSGFFPNIAWLLEVPEITPAIFKQVAPYVTARSETFRILSEGSVASTGARQRIQVEVRVGLDTVETLAYRDDF